MLHTYSAVEGAQSGSDATALEARQISEAWPLPCARTNFMTFLGGLVPHWVELSPDGRVAFELSHGLVIPIEFQLKSNSPRAKNVIEFFEKALHEEALARMRVKGALKTSL